jgi:hypothetical protein
MMENVIGDGPAAQAVLWSSDKTLLRAGAQYMAGVLHVVKRTAANNRVFFLGRVRPRATPLYFPLLYLLKEPLAFWLLVAGVVTAAGVTLRPRLDRALLDRHFEEIAIALWVALYGFMCVRTGLNLGIRHLLPIYPAVALLIAGLLAAIGPRLSSAVRPWARRAVVLLAVAHLTTTLSAHPSYLAFYNTLAGGPDGGRYYAVDSALDWGQDLFRLSDWVREKGIAKIEVDYFGGGLVSQALGDRGVVRRGFLSPETFGVSEETFRAENRTDGWIAVSVTSLETVLGGDRPSLYHWLVRRRPEAVIGHSILVWHVR